MIIRQSYLKNTFYIHLILCVSIPAWMFTFRSVGVSNFGIHHLEGLKAAGLPAPSVNQVELHPWQNQLKRPLVEYCQNNNIAVMGYCPLARNILNKAEDQTVIEMAKR